MKLATQQSEPFKSSTDQVTPHSWWSILRTAASQWSIHKDSRQGAALAYYSIFSLGPLIVIVIGIAGLVFGPDAVRHEIQSELQGLIGDTGAKAIEAMLAGASRPKAGLIAATTGAVTLIIAALGVVIQLKDAVNTVWEVKHMPGKGLWHFTRSYVLSLAGILAVGFLGSVQSLSQNDFG